MTPVTPRPRIAGEAPPPRPRAPASPSPATAGASGACPRIAVERVTVRPDRLSALVRVAPGVPRRTDAALAERARAAFPDLPHHTCVNEAGPTFAAVMDDTPLPHLLEHLAISLMLRDEATPACAAHVGTTEWLNEDEGLARVEVTYTDDIVALRALRRAAAFLNDEGRECARHAISTHHIRPDR